MPVLKFIFAFMFIDPQPLYFNVFMCFLRHISCRQCKSKSTQLLYINVYNVSGQMLAVCIISKVVGKVPCKTRREYNILLHCSLGDKFSLTHFMIRCATLIKNVGAPVCAYVCCGQFLVWSK